MSNSVNVRFVSYRDGAQINDNAYTVEHSGDAKSLRDFYVAVLSEGGGDVTTQGDEVKVVLPDGLTGYYTITD